MTYICGMENITLTLTPSEMEHLELVLAADFDNISYLLEQVVKEGDPNGEVEELSNHVLDTKNLLTKVQDAYTFDMVM